MDELYRWEGTSKFSSAYPTPAWYVGCESHELTRKSPIGRLVASVPVVLFRDGAGRPTALLDRCAHRNVPLSGGEIVDGCVQCPYHGWRFDTAGVCRQVPALTGPQEGKARKVPAFPVREVDGLVWVWSSPEMAVAGDPYRIPHMEDSGYTSVRYSATFDATLHATAENILDVPHTAFLHRGLFRGGKANRVEVVVRRYDGVAEAEYCGEPRPGGFLGRVLAPQGGTVEHFDRFIFPCVAQVEYRLGNSHLLITNLLTPESDFRTRMVSVLTLRLPIGGKALGEVIRRVMMPFALKVVEQDKVILSRQTDHIRRFGGEQFVSTDVDVLGPHIWKMLRQAERGESVIVDGDGHEEERFTMMA